MSTAGERAAMRAQARKDYPHLTRFDTGEALEPKPWPASAMEADGDWGKVDFTNDEDVTTLTLRAYESSTEDDVTVLDVDNSAGRLHVVVSGNSDVRMTVNGQPAGDTHLMAKLRGVLWAYNENGEEYAALSDEEKATDVKSYERYEDAKLTCADDFAFWVLKLLEGGRDAGQAQGPQDQDPLGD